MAVAVAGLGKFGFEVKVPEVGFDSFPCVANERRQMGCVCVLNATVKRIYEILVVLKANVESLPYFCDFRIWSRASWIEILVPLSSVKYLGLLHFWHSNPGPLVPIQSPHWSRVLQAGQ